MKDVLATLVRFRRVLTIAVLAVAAMAVAPLARAEAWAGARNLKPTWNWLLWGLLAAWTGYVVYSMASGGCPAAASPCSSPCHLGG